MATMMMVMTTSLYNAYQAVEATGTGGGVCGLVALASSNHWYIFCF